MRNPGLRPLRPLAWRSTRKSGTGPDGRHRLDDWPCRGPGDNYHDRSTVYFDPVIHHRSVVEDPPAGEALPAEHDRDPDPVVLPHVVVGNAIEGGPEGNRLVRLPRFSPVPGGNRRSSEPYFPDLPRSHIFQAHRIGNSDLQMGQGQSD